MTQLNHTDTHLTHQLSSLSTATWQEQINIISSLPVNTQIVKLINHRNFSTDLASLFASHNPRSKLITVLADYLLNLFASYSNQLISFSNLLITNECLLRLLGNGNKVLSGAANQLLKCIISHTDFKSKSKLIKFVHNLQYQFLNSKNNYVRQKISLYFLLISTSFYYQDTESLKEFQRKIVKTGLEDASDKVRKNMKEIMQNIYDFEKENKISAFQSVAFRKTVQPSQKRPGEGRYPSKSKQSKLSENILVNQSSILQNFSQHSAVINLTKQQYEDQKCFQFYLERLNTGNDWSNKLISYQHVNQMIKNKCLPIFNNQQLYCTALKQLTPFLSQKRNRIYQSCCEVFGMIIDQVKQSSKNKVINFILDNIAQILTNASKYQSSAQKLFPSIIQLNPSIFISKMSQISLQTKVYKEKLLILDSIIKSLPLLIQDSCKNKSNKKVCSIIKIMCQHINQSSNKQKQLSLAAMAIISHFKSKHPQDVLTTLLCQSDKLLSKIIDIAQSIDESLKTAVIDYINSLKNDNKKILPNPNSKQNSFQQIQQQIKSICQQKSSTLSKLGQLIFTHLEQLKIKDFIKILKLLQILCNSDLLIEFRILMGQICKTKNKNLIQALVQLLDNQGFQNSKQYLQYHQIFAIQMLATCVKSFKKTDSILQKVGKALIKIYRNDQSLKKRNAVIQTLTNMPQDILRQFLTPKQLKLTRLYSDQLKQQTQQFDF